MSDWQAFKRELEISQKHLAKCEELYIQNSEGRWKDGQKGESKTECSDVLLKKQPC